MSGDIDRISVAIGELKAMAAEEAKQRRAVWKTLNGMSASLYALAARLPPLESKVMAMEPHVEDWKRTKQRGIGVLFAAGAAGAGLTELLRRLMGS